MLLREYVTTCSNPARKLLVAAVLLALGAGTVMAGPTIHVDIPAQPLSASLRTLAAQAGAQVVFTSDAVGTAAGSAITGDMSIEDALGRLLAGTGLTYRKDGENSYVVVPAAPKGTTLDEVVVTATRTEQNVRDVPASVTVITARDIRAQQAAKVEQLLRNVEGIDIKSEPGGGVGMVMLRGVGGSYAGQTTQVLVDGMPVEPLALAPKGSGYEFTDVDEIERIEIVRGPASSLYGPGAMGGVINIIPKRWTGTPGGEVQIGRGSHDTWSLGAAGGGNWDKVDIRVSAHATRTDGFISEPEPYAWLQQDLEGRDWKDRKLGLKLNVYPAQNHQISVGVQDYYINSAWLGGRPEYRFDRRGKLYDLGYKVDFGDSTDLKLKYQHASVRENITWDGLYINGDPADFTQYVFGHRAETADMFEAQSNIRLARSNLLTVGASFNVGKTVDTEDWAVPADSIAAWDYYESNSNTNKTAVAGLYVQDEARIGNKVIVNVGGRHDHYRLYGNSYEVWTNLDGSSGRDDPDTTDDVFNPRAGVRINPTDQVSLYTTYGTAYLPATNALRYRSNPVCNNPDLDPESSKSLEFGATLDWDVLSTRLAAYRTDYEDKIESRLLGPCTQYQNIGEARVKGFELSVEGRGSKVWRPYANYTYTDSRVVSNPAAPDTEGKRLNLVSRDKINLGITYLPWVNTTLRLAGRYVGDRYFDGRGINQEGARAPGYSVADFKIIQRIPLGSDRRYVEIDFAVNNLFDKEYVENKWYWTSESFRQYGDGRNVWLNVRTRF